jgi:hypothetical protein
MTAYEEKNLFPFETDLTEKVWSLATSVEDAVACYNNDCLLYDSRIQELTEAERTADTMQDLSDVARQYTATLQVIAQLKTLQETLYTTVNSICDVMDSYQPIKK